MTVLAIILAVVAVLAGGAGVIAVRQKRSFARANEIVPGRSTNAPTAWAGAHTPEAKLHRRLIEAIAALRANPTLSDGAFMEARASIEQAASAIDDRLIAAAALPATKRDVAIAAVQPSVVALEEAVAALAAPSLAGVDTQQALDDSMRAARIRIDALAQARAELDQLDPLGAGRQIDDLDIGIQAQPPSEGGTTAPR